MWHADRSVRSTNRFPSALCAPKQPFRHRTTSRRACSAAFTQRVPGRLNAVFAHKRPERRLVRQQLLAHALSGTSHRRDPTPMRHAPPLVFGVMAAMKPARSCVALAAFAQPRVSLALIEPRCNFQAHLIAVFCRSVDMHERYPRRLSQ